MDVIPEVFGNNATSNVLQPPESVAVATTLAEKHGSVLK